MLGIEDKYVSAAYLLCIASSIVCIIYGLLFWNRGEERPRQEDVDWAAQEDKVEEEL